MTFAPNFASPSPKIAFNAAISASLSPIPSCPGVSSEVQGLERLALLPNLPRGRDAPPNDIDWQDAHANAADAILIATSGPHPGRSNERMVHVRSFRTSINASTIAGEASGIRNKVQPASPMRSGPAPAPAIAAIEFAGIRSRSVAGGPSCLTTAFTPPAGPARLFPVRARTGEGPRRVRRRVDPRRPPRQPLSGIRRHHLRMRGPRRQPQTWRAGAASARQDERTRGTEGTELLRERLGFGRSLRRRAYESPGCDEKSLQVWRRRDGSRRGGCFLSLNRLALKSFGI